MRFPVVWGKAAFAVCFVVGISFVSGAELTKLTASNGGGNDEFGVAVAVEGGVAVVGAFRDDSVNLSSGSAYVYHVNSTTGTWEEVRQLTASDAAAGDSFGNAVTVDGDLIVVGAASNDGATGSAYLFGRNEGGTDNWGEIVELWASDGAPLQRFGTSVALDGSTLAVGAIGDQGGSKEGVVYLFERAEGGEWTEVGKVRAADGAGLNRFGSALALDGDRLAVGAPGDSDNSANAGAVYIFSRTQLGGTVWEQSNKVRLTDFAEGDEFGISVDLQGDVLVAGASQAAAVEPQPGRAFVFERVLGSNSWSLVKNLSADEGSAGAMFGASVSIAGDLVAVGAPGESRDGLNAGTAYVFDRKRGWTQIDRLVGSDTSAQFMLGGSVSMEGSEVLVGALGDDYAGANSGSVYVFQPTLAPILSVERAGSDIVVSWTPDTAGFELERRASLESGEWMEAGSGSDNPVTLASGDWTGFFRVVGQGMVEIAFCPVGYPGNAMDATGFGQVSEAYQMGRFEVTNEEYTRFLNAVAGTDTFGLYSPQMEADGRGGIVRTGESGGYVYSVKQDMGKKPVNYVSFYDAARFANWLHNGQPEGGQDASSTEDGAYTFTGPTQVGSRNAGAKIWVPSLDEWYKAAYYDPTKNGGGGYWLNPTRSNETPEVATADAVGNISNSGANVANYGFGAFWNGLEGNVTTVGTAGNRSFFGAADMGGNVSEWNESLNGAFRGIRGGSWGDFESAMESTSNTSDDPSSENDATGFRVARP